MEILDSVIAFSSIPLGISFVVWRFFWFYDIYPSPSDEEKRPKNIWVEYLSFISFFLMFYSFKKWLELPSFLGLKHPLIIDPTNSEWFILFFYLFVLFVLVICLWGACDEISKRIYRYIKKKSSFFKGRWIWKNYEEYKTYFESGELYVSQLTKEGILKYRKRKIFIYEILDSLRKGDFINIERLFFIIISTIIYLVLFDNFYEGLLSGESLFFNSDIIMELNKGSNQFTNLRLHYWLPIVWAGGRFLFLVLCAMIFTCLESIYQICRFVYFDYTYRYNFHRAEDAFTKEDYRAAIKNYKVLRKNLSRSGTLTLERERGTNLIISESYLDERINNCKMKMN